MSPKQQERRFDPAYAKTLLEIAYGDYRTAVLCHRKIPVPLVHDLGALLAKLPDGTQPDAGYELTRFNDFAGVRRYEEGPHDVRTRGH